jgi:hypothetical protein
MRNHEEHGRIRRQRSRQRHPFAHPAGQLARRIVGEVGEPHLLEQRGDAPILFAARPACDLQRRSDVLARRSPWQQRIVLKQHPHPDRRRGDGLAVESHLPAGRCHQACGHLQQRRLSAAAGPDQSDELARAHQRG